MSTRSVTTISGAYGKHVALYRHMDGYPAEAGAAIYEALKDKPDPTEVVARLLEHKHEGYGGGSRRDYELTSNADDHGDAEYTYEANLSKDGWVVIFGKRNSDWKTWTKMTLSLNDFRHIVNADRIEINKRLAARRIEHPKNETGGDYPMLEGDPVPEPVMPKDPPRGISEDEKVLLANVAHFGSDSYPVHKVGSHHWTWGPVNSIKGPPVVFKTKKAAVESFEKFLAVLHEAQKELVS